MSFTSPNFTQTPNDLLGAVTKKNGIEAGMMADMGMAELKVVLAVCRLTFGFHRNKARASLSDIMTMTGLSRQGVINGANQAEERGLIKRIRDGGVTQWLAVVDNEVVNTVDQQEGETGQPSRPPSSKESNTEINKRELRSRLAKRFSKLTSLRFPKSVKTLNKTWWTPLLEVAELCEYDEDRTFNLIEWSLKHADSQGLTIKAPKSIEGIAIAEQARRKRTGGKPRAAPGRDNGKSSLGQVMDWMQELNEEGAFEQH